MPGERLSMRQIREVLRLRFASKLPQRAIAKSLGLSQGAVSGYLSRARAAGVSWPLSEDLDDGQHSFADTEPLPPAKAFDQAENGDAGAEALLGVRAASAGSRRPEAGPAV